MFTYVIIISVLDGPLRTPLFELQDVLNAFRRQKVVTKQELLQNTGCSTMTAWRLLRQHGDFTSDNENSRYDTIVGIPQFDEHGLWVYRNARFSKWGTLTKTIIALLVEIIRRPQNTPRQGARRLTQEGIYLGTDDIETVRDHYGIDLKKGPLKSCSSAFDFCRACRARCPRTASCPRATIGM